MMCGFLLVALFFGALQRRGVPPDCVLAAGMAAGVLVLLGILLGAGRSHVLWFLLGLVVRGRQPLLRAPLRRFPPSLAGRANTALNLCVFAGAFLIQWGYGVSLDLLDGAWMGAGRRAPRGRRHAARPPGGELRLVPRHGSASDTVSGRFRSEPAGGRTAKQATRRYPFATGMATCPKCHRESEREARFCSQCGASFAASSEGGHPPDPFLGRTLKGVYRVQQKIGDGGMGTSTGRFTWNSTRRSPSRSSGAPSSPIPRVVGRFQREARAACRLRHPNVVSVTDFGQTEDGILFMVMEHVPGGAWPGSSRRRRRCPSDASSTSRSRSSRRSPRRTPARSCTATSSPRTSWSRRGATRPTRSRSSTSGSPRPSWTAPRRRDSRRPGSWWARPAT